MRAANPKKRVDSIKAPKAETVEALPLESDFVVEEKIEEPEAGKTAGKTTKKSKVKNTHKRILVALLSTFLAFVVFSILVAGAAFAEEKMYDKKVFPGVVVWGMPVGGKTVEQVEALIVGKIMNYRLSLDGPDQDYSATVEDLGIIFNTETIALSAYSKGRTSSFFDNYLIRARLLLLKIEWEPLQKIIRSGDLALPINFQLDEEKFNSYVDSVVNNISIKPQDSNVTIQGSQIKVIPAVYGREVAKEELKTAILGEASVLKSSKIIVKTTEIRPNVVDKAAEELRIQTESVISRPIILTYNGQEYRPNKETIASWVSYTKEANAKNYEMKIDTGKMNNYFAFLDSKINIYPVSKKVRVENGVKQTVIREGSDGTLVDKVTLGKKIAETLPLQAKVELTIPTYISKFKTEYENVIVADWDKYIDINLSTQTMTAYLKGGEVVASWKVTTGAKNTPTPVGTWLIHGKTAVTRMTGGTRGIDYYDLPNVHWVSWFKGGGYAIHEAYWRSTFGGMDYLYTGSHGCVNAPIDVAAFIYNWAPIGTPVIVHY